MAFLPEILTKSADARKMALSLKHVEYGGELLSQLMSSSSKMEKLHEKLNDLVTRSVDDDSKYIKLCDIAEKEMKWFDKAKARLQRWWGYIYLPIYLSIYLSIDLPIYLPIYLSVYLSIYLASMYHILCVYIYTHI